MQVILLKDVAGVGKRGQLVTVNDGYGTNFLIRRSLASPATKDVKERVQRESKELVEKNKRIIENAQKRKVDMEKRTFSIPVTVGEGGKIFGAVRERDVAEALSEKLGVSIEKHSVLLPAPIKTLGEHKVQVRIQGGLTAVVTINVISA